MGGIATASTAGAPRRSAAVLGDPRWPLVVLAGVLTLLTLSVASAPFDTDGWWHLRVGELILDRRSFPRTDPFSWTALGEPWRLDSWLFDVVAALLRRVGGPGLVSAVVLLAFAGFGAASYALARSAGARPWPSVAATTVVSVMLTPYVAERAQMASYLLFLAVIPLARSALGGSNRALAGLAALVVLWSNLHLAFAVGVLMVGLLATADVVHRRRLHRPATVLAVAALGGLVNPVGIAGYTAGLHVRRASSLVTEWQPVDLSHPRDVALVLVAAGAGLSLWRTGRWRRLDHLLPLAAFSVLAADAIRQGPYLLAVAAPELALGFGTLAMRRLRTWTQPRAAPLVHGVVLGLALLIALSLPGALPLRPPGPDQYPVAATAAIPEGCRVLNEYEAGGYIIDRRWPEVLVSVDGRNDVYGSGPLHAQQDVLAGETGAREWLDRHGVDCVVARPDRPLVRALREAGWREPAADARGVLLVRP